MVDTKYDEQTGEPLWKEQGADTWHPFKSDLQLIDSGSRSYSTWQNISFNSTLEKGKYILFLSTEIYGNLGVTNGTIESENQGLTPDGSGYKGDLVCLIDVPSDATVTFSFNSGKWDGCRWYIYG